MATGATGPLGSGWTVKFGPSRPPIIAPTGHGDHAAGVTGSAGLTSVSLGGTAAVLHVRSGSSEQGVTLETAHGDAGQQTISTVGEPWQFAVLAVIFSLWVAVAWPRTLLAFGGFVVGVIATKLVPRLWRWVYPAKRSSFANPS
jgi:hypothetical protein